MNHSHRSNATMATVPSVQSQPGPPLDLDDHVRLACEGDRDAADVVARELRTRLVNKAAAALGGRLQQDADDVVHDLLVAMLEGRIRPKRGRGEAVQTLLRMAVAYARRHAHEARRRAREHGHERGHRDRWDDRD